MEALRLFIAVEVPAAAKAAVDQWLEPWRREERHVSWSRPASWHLTLSFLGEVEGERVEAITAGVQAAVRTMPPFAVGLGGLGVFPRVEAPQVLWLSMGKGSEALAALQARVAQALARIGFPPETRAFHPHLTLGRVRPGRRVQVPEERWTQEPWIEVWKVNAVQGFRSRLTPAGAQHETLFSGSLLG